MSRGSNSMFDFELDHSMRVLEEAEEIRKDQGLMTKIERRMKERVTDLQKVEAQLFGGDSKDELETEEVE